MEKNESRDMRRQWFADLVGYDESQWDYTIESLPKVVLDSMGSFRTPSLGELKEIIKHFPKEEVKPLHVRIRHQVRVEPDTQANDHLFDTSSLQYNGLEHSMYQVASNFNCLEVASVYANPFSGKFLTNLMEDTTQGPSAAGGAGAGTILRLALHKQNPINLLSDTILKPVNGKLLCHKLEEEINVNAIKVGLHQDVRAMYQRSYRCFNVNLNGPIIDQIYTSTCISRDNKPHKLSDILLKSAYEGTYLCAVMRQSKKLVLTLIGGGCFRNSEAQIVDALIYAHTKWCEYLPCDCEVILPIYSHDFHNILCHLKSKLPIITQEYA